MKLARLTATLALSATFVVAAAGLAHAGRVVLHSKDSITIDGTKYSCDDPSSDGVNLALGDQITVGKKEIRCKTPGDPSSAPTAAAPAPTPTVDVTSSVDPGCLTALTMISTSTPTPAETIVWAKACRTFELDSKCTAVTEAADDGCFTTLHRISTGGFANSDEGRATTACRARQATCPAPSPAVTSSVDMSCMSSLFMAATAPVSADDVAGWTNACRTQPVGACVVVGGSYDSSCVSASFQMITNPLLAKDAGKLARGCRTLQLACP